MKSAPLILVVFLLTVQACNDKPEYAPETIKLYVFPNPATDLVSIRFMNSEGAPYVIKIFNPDGELIFEKNESLSEPIYNANISTEAEGTYHVVLDRNNTTSVTRFIKIAE